MSPEIPGRFNISTPRAPAAPDSTSPDTAANAEHAPLAESRDWWDEHVADGEYLPTAEGLAEFIRESLEPICHQLLQEMRFAPAIKAQTLGEGLQAH
jgi:hypothetical protein